MAGSSTLTMLVLLALGASGAALAAYWAEAQGLAFGMRVKCGLAALVLLSLAFAAAIYPLGRPALVFGALSNPSAGLFREFASLLAALFFSVLYLAALFRARRARTTTVLAILAAIFSFAAPIGAVSTLWMPWRAGWHTASLMLPAAGFSISGGILLFRSLIESQAARIAAENVWDEAYEGKFERDIRTRALKTAARSRFDALLPAAGAALYLAALSSLPAPSQDPTAARLLTGDLCAPFWASMAIGAGGPFFLAVKAKHFGVREGIFALALTSFGAALYTFTVMQLGSAAWNFFSR